MKHQKARLEELYLTTLRKQLKKDLSIDNIMCVPRLTKIVVNMGVKEAVGDSKVLTGVKKVIEQITGQTAVRTYAKKSVAGFKLREGMPIGIKVTLRRRKMYEFLDRLINLSLPRVRDFQGLNPQFDKNGNYNLGIKDWMIFPEVDYDKVDKMRGLNITIETNTSSNKKAYALLLGFRMPFRGEVA